MSEAGGEDDDHDWLAALAGRPRTDSAATTRLEAAMLRRALREVGLDTVPAAPTPASVNDLLNRARAEGLLRPRHRWCHKCADRWQAIGAWLRRRRAIRLRTTTTALVLTSVLGGWALLPLLMPETVEAPTLRAGPGEVVQLVDEDPLARRDAIADALLAAGITVQRYERLGRAGLDASLPQAPLSPALQRILRSLGLAAPADGVLRIEVSAPER